MAMDSVSKFLSEERDLLYIKGITAGKVEGTSERNMDKIMSRLLETDSDDEKIAKLVRISPEIAGELRASLGADSQ
jgi:DNA-directed RNA polymerase subunit F